MAPDPIQHLLGFVPEYTPIYEEFRDGWVVEEPLPMVVICSDLFSDFVKQQMQENNQDVLSRVFRYIEDLAASDDDYASHIAFYFLEFFPSPRNLYEQTHALCGPKSKELLEALRKPIDEYRLED